MISWLLRSRWHLYGSIVLLLALLLFACRAGGGEHDPAPPGGSTDLPDTAVPTYDVEIDQDSIDRLLADSEEALPSGLAVPTTGIEPLPTEADPDALNRARGFTTAWLATSTPDWPENLAPWASPTLLAGLRETDPANVPAGSVQDVSAEVVGNTYTEVVVLIGEGSTVTVSLTLGPDGWSVVDVRP